MAPRAFPGARARFATGRWRKILDLFARLRAGEFPDGAKTLRAKIDMASPNIHLRDPAIYRIRKVEGIIRTGAQVVCIYPICDYAHCLSDSIEGITHSISAPWSSKSIGRFTTGSWIN